MLTPFSSSRMDIQISKVTSVIKCQQWILDEAELHAYIL